MRTLEERRNAARVANRAYYERHREAEKERSKLWRLNNQEKYKAWVEKSRERIRANSRKYEYNILPEQYEAKKAEQEGRCAICRKEVGLLVVDHDHNCCESRKTCGNCNRGLLCRPCNTLIGLANESVEVLNSAIQYLEKHNGN